MINLMGEFSALVWAREYVRINPDADEETMLGWFANAIMTGYDEANHRSIDSNHLHQQRTWSTQTFGPGARTDGVIAHIRKELDEILADPTDLMEWVDVLILAFDGAWRAGWEPQQIIDAIKQKQSVNENRQWPDWKEFTESQAIEHVK